MADLAEFMPAVEASTNDAQNTRDAPSDAAAKVDNKFQDAIAAWRSMCFARGAVLATPGQDTR